MRQVYYHYTSKEGAAGIAETGIIRQSRREGSGSGDDARFGNGVYMTTHGPERGKQFIAWNNYDGRNPTAIANFIMKQGN